MRIRRIISRAFRRALFPAVMLGLSGYFAHYALWGERGWQALIVAETRLDAKQARLDTLVAERKRLEHRIELLKDGDPDIVEELARTKLMDGAPGQVAVPRGDLGK